MTALQPIKASLIADLVDLININLADLLQIRCVTCPDCSGRGTIGGERKQDGTVFDDGTLATCATCGGVGAIERFVVDPVRLKSQKFGRLVEGFEVKQGQLVPKMRSKDKAFAMLIKLLGFDKAILELTEAPGSITASMSVEQRAQYVEQLKELAAMGLLDTTR